MFQSPSKCDTPECVAQARNRFYESTKEGSGTPVTQGGRGLPSLEKQLSTKRRRRSFVERSNSIISNHHNHLLTDQNFEELLEELNHSKAELKCREKEVEKERLRADLAEQTLKASREASRQLDDLIKELQVQIDSERRDRMRERQLREDVEKKYLESFKNGQTRTEDLEERYRDEIDTLEAHVEELMGDKTMLAEEKAVMREELVEEREKTSDLGNTVIELHTEVARLQMSESLARQELRSMPDNLTELMAAADETAILKAQMTSLEQDRKMIGASKNELEEAQKIRLENDRLKKRLSNMTFHQDSYLIAIQTEKATNEKCERLCARLETAEAEADLKDGFKIRAEKAELESRQLVEQVALLQKDVLELGEIRKGTGPSNSEDNERYISIQRSFLELQEENQVLSEKLGIAMGEKKQLERRITMLKAESEKYHQVILDYESEVTLAVGASKRIQATDELYRMHKQRNTVIEEEFKTLRTRTNEVTLQFVKARALMKTWEEIARLPEVNLAHFLPQTEEADEGKGILDYLSANEINTLKESLEAERRKVEALEDSARASLKSIAMLEVELDDFRNPPVIIEFAQNPMKDKLEEKKQRLKSLESDKNKLLAKVAQLERTCLRLQETLKASESKAAKFENLKQTLEERNMELTQLNQTLQNQTITLNQTLQNQTIQSATPSQGLDTTNVEISGDAIAEINELRKKIKEGERHTQKQIDKTKNVFIGKIKEMLDFTEKVLGFRIKKSKNNYFLYSNFSENEQEVFHFCISKDEVNKGITNFELQTNETFEHLVEHLREQLERQKCLPSFFASWQLDLYSQMTTLN